MRILVIGGSYFLGRYFVLEARKEHTVTVFNRGSTLLNLADVDEIRGDRTDGASLEILGDRKFDVVVDFCAYNKGDIAKVIDALKYKPGQYIFISTVDVYERGVTETATENTAFETRDFGGEAGQYILGKVALEKEIIESAAKSEISYTVLRPAFIYGPGNYAPREGIYFHWIEQAGQILHPEDATGEFQMTYVGDVSRAILASLGNEQTYNQAYNLAPDTVTTYETFAQALAESVGQPFECVPVSVAFVLDNSIPLPFPLTKEESNLYDGTKALELIGEYTKLSTGLELTRKQ